MDRREFSQSSGLYSVLHSRLLGDMHKKYPYNFAIMPFLTQNIAGCGVPSKKMRFCNIEKYFTHKAAFTRFPFSYYDRQNRDGLPGRFHGAENRKGVEL